MGFTVFHHAILLLDTLLRTLFSLKYTNVKSNTAFSICADKKYMASIRSPMLQYKAYLYLIVFCLLGTRSLADLAQSVSQLHLPEVLVLGCLI